MSYTIIKSFKATNEKLYYVCGDNNIVPHIWSECEQDASDANIKALCLGIVEGYYKPYSGLKLAKYAELILSEYNKLKTVSCFENDWQYEVQRSYEFDELFAGSIGIALFKDLFYGENTITVYNYNQAKKELAAYEEESARIYKAAEEKQKENKVISIHCALISDIFAGHDILIDDNERLIIAKRENYDNHGHLDNKDGSAIILDGVESSSEHLYFLSDGSNFKNVDDEVYNKIESTLLNTNTNLYNSFHILKLAKEAVLSY